MSSMVKSSVSGRQALGAAVAVGAVVLVPLVVSPTIVVRGGFDFDRVEDAAHAGAAAIVVIALLLLQRQPRLRGARVRAASLTLAAGLGAEAIQMWAPGRTAGGADLVYDAIGVVVGLVMVDWAQRWLTPDRLRWGVAVLLMTLGIGTLALVH